MMETFFKRAALALSVVFVVSNALPAQTRLPDRPARVVSPMRPLKMPPTYGVDRVADEILATFEVESSGAVRSQSARIVSNGSSGAMLQQVREYLRELNFVPAISNGRAAADSVQVRFTISIETFDDRPLTRVHCSDCDETLESHRQRVNEQALNAVTQGTECGRVFREIARTSPTDTLVWAASHVRSCANVEQAAAFAVRIMSSGRHPDSTYALRTKIATAFPSRAVVDAAMAVAAQGQPVAQVYALEVLDRLQPAPRALGTLYRAPFRDRCGPYVVDSVRTPTELAAEYIPFVRQLATNLLQDSKTEDVVRRVAQCLLDGLSF